MKVLKIKDTKEFMDAFDKKFQEVGYDEYEALKEMIDDIPDDEEVEDDLVEIHGDMALTKNDLVFHNVNDALTVAQILIKEDYCVMLSTEENLTILNYVETITDGGCSPRSYVVFNSKDDLNKDWIY